MSASLPPDVKLQTVAEIGNLFDEHFVNHIKLLSDDYFLDADILIVSISALQLEFSQLMGVEGFINFYMSGDSLQKFEIKLTQRKSQIDQYLQRGGVLFVVIDNNPIYSYQLEHGSNATQTSMDFMEVMLLNSNDFLMEQMRGTNIVYSNSIYTTFFNSWDVAYSFVYSKFKGYSIAKVKNTNQAISVAVPYGKGLTLLLPQLGLSADNYSDYESRQHNARHAMLNFVHQYQESKSISQTVSLPEWCNDYLLGNEANELNKLMDLQEELAEKQKCILKQEEILEQYYRLKQLLGGGGKSLEAIVEQLFSEIGFELLPMQPDRDDLIIQWGDQVGVVEIKGVKGSASEQNATQLMKWVSNFHHENNIEPKGFLIVNAYKDVSIENRKENAFPHQMLAYSKRMQFCLITTYQLLGLYIDFKEGAITFNALKDLIFDTIGPLDYRPSKIIKRTI